MNKKIILFLVTVLIIEIIFIIYEMINKANQNIDDTVEKIEVAEESAVDEVTDSCIDEWEEYVSKKIEEASNNLVEDNTHYKLKNVDGYIEVYYVDDKGEYLYRKTNISTEYLSKEDTENLDNGIEVVGAESLNKMLEDFE